MTTYEHTLLNVCNGIYLGRQFNTIDFNAFDENKPLDIYIASIDEKIGYRHYCAVGLIFKQGDFDIYYDSGFLIKNKELSTKYLGDTLGIIMTLDMLKDKKFKNVNFISTVIKKNNFQTRGFNKNFALYNMLEKAIRKDNDTKPFVNFKAPNEDEEELMRTTFEIVADNERKITRIKLKKR